MKRLGWSLLFLLPICACTTVPSKRGTLSAEFSGHKTVVPEKPYEKHLRWKVWDVWVRSLPVHAGEVVWYEVQVGRVENEKIETLHRATYDSDGPIQAAWLDDPKKTGRPVLILFMSGGGNAHYGTLRLLECRDSGLRVLEGPNTARALLEGYRGGDTWVWNQGVLTRGFPIYMEGDETGVPRGGRRILRYSWERGRWRVRFHNEMTAKGATIDIP